MADELTVGVAISVKFMSKTKTGLYIMLLRSSHIHNFAIYSRRYGRVGYVVWSYADLGAVLLGSLRDPLAYHGPGSLCRPEKFF